MRNPKIHYAYVGAFVIAMGVGLVATLAVLSGGTGDTDTYKTSYRDATGLKFGTQVFYMGFPVGQVEKITPVANGERIAFEVDLALTEEFAGWNVPADSVAQIKAPGLLAAITIDIRTGTSRDALAPGDRIAGAEQTDVFGAVTETANTLRELTRGTVKPLIENLDRAVGTFSSVVERDAGPLIRNFAIVAEQLAQSSPRIISNFLTTTDEISQTSRSLRGILSDENAGKVGSVLDRMEESASHIVALTEHARGQLEALLGDRTLQRVDVTLENVAAASGDLRELAGDTNRQAKRALSDENVDRIAAIVANLDAASEDLRTTTREARERVLEALGDEHMEEIDRTFEHLSAAAEVLESTMRDARTEVATLLGPGTRSKIDEALVNLSGASANVAELSRNLNVRLKDVLTPETADRVRLALERFGDAAANVAALTGDLHATRATLDDLLETLDAIADDNRSDVRRAVADLRRSLDAVAQHINAVTYNLEGTSRNMLEFSREIRSNPGLLLRGSPPERDGLGPRAARGGGG